MEMLFVQCSVHTRHAVNTKQDNAQTIYRLVTCVCLLWWRRYTNSKGMHVCVCVHTDVFVEGLWGWFNFQPDQPRDLA